MNGVSRDVHYRCINSNYLPTKAENWACDILYDNFITERQDNAGFDGEHIIRFETPNTLIEEDCAYDLFCFDSIIIEFDTFMRFITNNQFINMIKDEVKKHRCDYILFHFF